MSDVSNLSDRERRKAKRLTHMTFPSHLQLEDATRNCVVREVSETGARIEVEHPADLPEEFVLHLAGSVARKCRIVWRGKNEIGIRWTWLGDPSVMRAWRAIF